MGKIFYIILISYVCLIINSCAEIDRSSESANSSLTEQIWFSAYDILIGTTLMSSDNLFAPEQTSTEKGGNSTPTNNNIFLVKQNSSGSREWIEQLGKSAVEYGARLIVDSSDNIYVTGFSSEFESDNEFGSQNTLLAKYDSSGTRAWTKPLGSTLTDFAWDVTVDSTDNIYVTGFSENSFAQNTSWQDDDILLMKFNTDGIKL